MCCLYSCERTCVPKVPHSCSKASQAAVFVNLTSGCAEDVLEKLTTISVSVRCIEAVVMMMIESIFFADPLQRLLHSSSVRPLLLLLHCRSAPGDLARRAPAQTGNSGSRPAFDVSLMGYWTCHIKKGSLCLIRCGLLRIQLRVACIVSSVVLCTFEWGLEWGLRLMLQLLATFSDACFMCTGVRWAPRIV